jgi:hypothetical protein
MGELSPCWEEIGLFNYGLSLVDKTTPRSMVCLNLRTSWIPIAGRCWRNIAIALKMVG